MIGISHASDFMYFLGKDAVRSDIKSAVFSEERVLTGLQDGVPEEITQIISWQIRSITTEYMVSHPTSLNYKHTCYFTSVRAA